MERALQRRLQMDDAVFNKFWSKHSENIKIQGDILLVCSDRPWHHKTRQEIYSLLGVCKQLDLCLPRLVIELIAYFIQQAEVFADFRNNIIQMEFYWIGIGWSTANRYIKKYKLAEFQSLEVYWGSCLHTETQVKALAQIDKCWLADSLVQWLRNKVISWDRYRVQHYWRDHLAKNYLETL